MRIAHIIDSLAMGGAEVLLINSVKEYKNHYPASEHYIVVLKKEGDRQLKEQAMQWGTFFDLGLKKSNFVAVRAKFRSLIHKEEIDVIHSHLLDATLFCRIAKPPRAKLVSTYHNVVYDKTNVFFSRWRLLLDKLTYRKAYYSIFVSKAVSENIRSVIPIKTNCTILLNFAGREFTNSYTYNPDPALKLISVGNLKPNKNHESAVLALSRLKQLPVTLHIYGEGELRPHLENLIKSTGANVRLMGKQKISAVLLSAYDAFLMTSFNEGMPVSLIEAMAAGLPAILNDLPMLRDTAASAAAYYKKNDGDDLVAVLHGVLKNKAVLQELANESVKISKRYAVENYVNALHAIYSETDS